MTPSAIPEPPTGVFRAGFNSLIRPYLVLCVGLFLICTIVLIPLAVVWFFGLGQWWARHYFEKLECELGPETLRFRKGILFQVEKTIPLENIQDVTFLEGPLLKRFHLSVLKFETAGQSAGQAHDMRLIGIINAHEFRSKILQHRKRLKQGNPPSPHGNESALPHGMPAAVNEQILTVLRSILARLDEIAARFPENR